MQSSTAIAFRALIMLIFLISVPLVAIFGKDLPDVIKGLVEGRLAVHLTEPPSAPAGQGSSSALQTGIGTPPLVNNPFGEAAPYRAAQPGAAANATGGSTPNMSADTSSTAPPAGFPSPLGVAPGSAPATVAPTGNLPASAEANSSPAPGVNAGLAAPTPEQNKPPANWPPPTTPSRPEAFHPAPESRPIAGSEQPKPNDSSGDVPHNSSPGLAGGGDDKFRLAETRLRELGATHYVLETWGPQNNRYRFACRMAVGGNIGVNRHFEAVDDDPWRSMEDVLGQVEAWRKQSGQ